MIGIEKKDKGNIYLIDFGLSKIFFFFHRITLKSSGEYWNSF